MPPLALSLSICHFCLSPSETAFVSLVIFFNFPHSYFVYLHFNSFLPSANFGASLFFRSLLCNIRVFFFFFWSCSFLMKVLMIIDLFLIPTFIIISNTFCMLYFCLKVFPWAREMTLWVKYSLCNQLGPEFRSQHLHKMPGMVVCTCNHSTWGDRGRGITGTCCLPA